MQRAGHPAEHELRQQRPPKYESRLLYVLIAAETGSDYASGGRIRSDPSVQVKRVSVSFGATPLGRRPRRTKSVGTSAPRATANRVSADAFGSPAIGQADDEQAGVAGRFEDTCFARADENGLGDDSDNLLHQKRGAGKKPAGVAAPESGIRLGSEEPERRPERLGEPGGHLDRGPVVLDASERRHDRSGGHLSGP